MENSKDNMTTSNENKGQNDNKGGPKYIVNIEGQEFPWEKDTITTEEIIALGGLNPTDGVIEVNMQDQTEVTLKPGQIVEIKPGFGFSKKVTFKRG